MLHSVLSGVCGLGFLALSAVVLFVGVPSQCAADDLRAMIAEGVRRGDKRIVIPPGRYRVKPLNREHLRLSGLKNVEIVADGVEMICTETTRALTITGCENVKVRGLTIDYDPLPFTQGRVTAIAADSSHFDIEIIDGYADIGFRDHKAEVFDPSTNLLRGGTTYYGIRIQPTGPKKATVFKEEGNRTVFEKVGDIVVLDIVDAPGGSIPHAIYSEDSGGLRFENVTLFAANSFGFLEQRCEGNRYLGCRVDRRPPEDDPAVRAYPRLRSLNADAYHSKNARIGPLIERCVARFMGDDAVAINGDFHFISGGHGAALRVIAKTRMTMMPGDRVQIFAYDGNRLPDRTIVAVTPDGKILPDELEFLSLQRMDVNTRTRLLQDAFAVTLDQPVDVPRGSLVCSADRIGNGFAVRNSDFGFNRSRGILVKAGRGEISGNRITSTAGVSILIEPEYWWLEAGFADDLKITNNIITDPGSLGIRVSAKGGSGRIAAAGAFRNLVISGNSVEGGPVPGILVTSVQGLVLENNCVDPSPTRTLPRREAGPWGEEGLRPVMTFQCEPGGVGEPL